MLDFNSAFQKIVFKSKIYTMLSVNAMRKDERKREREWGKQSSQERPHREGDI